MNHLPFVEQTSHEEVFELLSDDTRIEILRTLWAADDRITFSELHDASTVNDSAQFNYHLQKLVGRFVEKTGEGYTLTVAGSRINGAIEAGRYISGGAMDPVQIDSPCQLCGGKRTFHYTDGTAQLMCDSCDIKAKFPIPPSVFANVDREQIPTVAGEYLSGMRDRLNRGFCPHCDGRVDPTVLPVIESPHWDETVDIPDASKDPQELPIVVYKCQQCGNEPTNSLTLTLLSHPAVVAFYYDHGINIRNRSIWEFFRPGTERELIRSRDPFRAVVTFSVDSAELTLVVDANKTVIETKES